LQGDFILPGPFGDQESPGNTGRPAFEIKDSCKVMLPEKKKTAPLCRGKGEKVR